MASIQKRKCKDGTASYRVEVRLKGHPPERATFHRKTDANKWAQDTESAIRQGRYFKTRESQRHTLSELITIYSDDVLTSKKDGKKTKAQLQWWCDELGHFTLSEITPGRITECKKKLLIGITYRGTKRSPATVNRYLAALSVCLTYAVKELSWLDDSPARKVTKYSETRGRVRFLSEDEVINDELQEGEITKLLKACEASKEEYLYIVVVMALSTGMRRGEIINLKWSEIDLKRGRVTLYKTKNEEIRVIPISGYLLDLLNEHSKVRSFHSQLVFPGKVHKNKPRDLTQAWYAAIKEAGIEDFKFHDLRHTAASYLAMNGATLADIASVLGHKTLAMVKRYAHLSETHTLTVISKLDQRMFGNSGG